MDCIVCRGGYKYQLKQTYATRVPLHPAEPIRTEYVRLEPSGEMTIKEGYA